MKGIVVEINARESARRKTGMSDALPKKKLVKISSRPRPSSTDDPTEWDITEDGYEFSVGDIVFNYYDCEWVEVLTEPEDTGLGWFSVRRVGTKSEYTLNSVRVSWNYPPWYTPKDKDKEVEPKGRTGGKK